MPLRILHHSPCIRRMVHDDTEGVSITACSATSKEGDSVKICSATSELVTDATTGAASLSVYCSEFEVDTSLSVNQAHGVW